MSVPGHFKLFLRPLGSSFYGGGNYSDAGGPVRGHAVAPGQTPSSDRLYFGYFGFEPGPYFLGASGRTLHHDNLPSPGGLVAVVPVLENAHLLKAAPDLFTVAQALAALPALPTTSDAEALAARIAVLVQAAHVAVARAIGALP